MNYVNQQHEIELPNRWPKGVSGNPAGRKKTDVTVRELARENTEAAILALLDIVTNQKAAPRTRLAAAKAILDRAWERPRHFKGSKKKSIREYVDKCYGAKYGLSDWGGRALRRADKKERELDAVIEQAENAAEMDWL